MRLLIVFLGVLAAGLVFVGALNWWVDPLGEFYEEGVVAAADRSTPPCLLALDVVGTPSWPAFKEELVRRRRAATIVIGTSRVLKLGEGPGEEGFVNAGLPGTGPETLEPLLRRFRAATPNRVTVLLGVEAFWFNRTWFPGIQLERRRFDTAAALLSRKTAETSLRLIRADPGLLRARHRRGEAGGACVIERSRRAERGEVDAWELDGSFRYRFELVPTESRVPEDDYTRDVVTFQGIYYRDWDRLDPARLRALERALELARGWGWNVIGFFPPYSPRYVERLAEAPQTATRWRELERIPQIFRRQGFAFADLRDVRDVPCPADAFVDDGWHVTDGCAARVRAALDRTAAASP